MPYFRQFALQNAENIHRLKFPTHELTVPKISFDFESAFFKNSHSAKILLSDVSLKSMESQVLKCVFPYPHHCFFR